MEDDDFLYDEADYGLEYSEESASEPDVDLENQYYLAKTVKEDNPASSLAAFQKVLDLQGESKGEWGFKALKQMVKINFRLKLYDETMKHYKEMLTYIHSAVTKNHGEKSINSILDYTSSSKNMDMLRDFYEATLEALRHAKNDRLWFKTNTKLGKVFLERSEFCKLTAIIRQLKQAVNYADDGEVDPHKGTQLLEIYALEIQMYTEQKNNKKLKELYERSMRVRSAIPHPLIMSVMRECGGKMYLRAEQFDKAYTDFFEAFKNYDESGNPRRITCLNYLILTSMLMKSSINPLDSQEAKPYRNDPDIKAMTELILAYQNSNMKEFEKIYRENKEQLNADPFMHEHLENILVEVRRQVILKLVKPYHIVKMEFLGMEMGITEEEVEDLLVNCILENLMAARIDQINRTLVKKAEMDNKSYISMNKLADQIDSISKTIVTDKFNH